MFGEDITTAGREAAQKRRDALEAAGAQSEENVKIQAGGEMTIVD